VCLKYAGPCVCCRESQCVAACVCVVRGSLRVCRSALQCAIVCYSMCVCSARVFACVLQCVTMCERVACTYLSVCCSGLQDAAARRNMQPFNRAHTSRV